MSKKRNVFEREFEGLDVLDELLQISHATLDAHGVVVKFREALARGDSAQQTVPTLFEEEPRFPDPEYARMLYQNLLGLWDLVEAGETIDVARPERPKKVKKAPPTAPVAFSEGGPDEAWVEASMRYLQEVDERAMDRLVDAFENRQDALLQHLEERNLSEDAWQTARSVFFELFALIELGWPPGVRSVHPADLDAAEKDPSSPPSALWAYVEEVLGEAETDDEAPLGEDEAASLRTLCRRGLKALWRARKPAGRS